MTKSNSPYSKTYFQLEHSLVKPAEVVFIPRINKMCTDTEQTIVSNIEPHVYRNTFSYWTWIAAHANWVLWLAGMKQESVNWWRRYFTG